MLVNKMQIFIATTILVMFGPLVEWWIGTHDKNINYKNVNQLQWYLQTRNIYDMGEKMFGLKLLIQWLYFPFYIIYVILWEAADLVASYFIL